MSDKFLPVIFVCILPTICTRSHKSWSKMKILENHSCSQYYDIWLYNFNARDVEG
jgi:hypothetical protein